eukprot:3549708-Rhodomonas_salina.1
MSTTGASDVKNRRDRASEQDGEGNHERYAKGLVPDRGASGSGDGGVEGEAGVSWKASFQRLPSASSTASGPAIIVTEYEDGRVRTIYSAQPKTWKKHSDKVNLWPPGIEAKYPLSSVRERMVEAMAAQEGELVRVASEFALASECARFSGKTGRLTRRYGDGYWGVLFDGEKKEVVLNTGESGLYQLSYVHVSESKEALFDIVPVPRNAFGKVVWHQREEEDRASERSGGSGGEEERE